MSSNSGSASVSKVASTTAKKQQRATNGATVAAPAPGTEVAAEDVPIGTPSMGVYYVVEHQTSNPPCGNVVLVFASNASDAAQVFMELANQDDVVKALTPNASMNLIAFPNTREHAELIISSCITKADISKRIQRNLSMASQDCVKAREHNQDAPEPRFPIWVASFFHPMIYPYDSVVLVSAKTQRTAESLVVDVLRNIYDGIKMTPPSFDERVPFRMELLDPNTNSDKPFTKIMHTPTAQPDDHRAMLQVMLSRHVHTAFPPRTTAPTTASENEPPPPSKRAASTHVGKKRTHGAHRVCMDEEADDNVVSSAQQQQQPSDEPSGKLQRTEAGAEVPPPPPATTIDI